MLIDNIVSELGTNALMKDRNQDDRFATALTSLRRLQEQNPFSVDDMTKILMVFDDNVEDQYQMMGLLHTIERADANTYIAALILSVGPMKERASEWSKTLISRLVNHNEYRHILIEQLRLHPKSIMLIRQILSELLEESEKHQEPITRRESLRAVINSIAIFG